MNLRETDVLQAFAIQNKLNKVKQTTEIYPVVATREFKTYESRTTTTFNIPEYGNVSIVHITTAFCATGEDPVWSEGTEEVIIKPDKSSCFLEEQDISDWTEISLNHFKELWYDKEKEG